MHAFQKVEQSIPDLPFSLTLTLSRWEREQQSDAVSFSEGRPANPVAGFRERRRM